MDDEACSFLHRRPCWAVEATAGEAVGRSAGLVVLCGSFSGVFECCCMSVRFGVRLVWSKFRVLCMMFFSDTSNSLVVVIISVFGVFGLFCGLVDGGV